MARKQLSVTIDENILEQVQEQVTDTEQLSRVVERLLIQGLQTDAEDKELTEEQRFKRAIKDGFMNFMYIASMYKRVRLSDEEK